MAEIQEPKTSPIIDAAINGGNVIEPIINNPAAAALAENHSAPTPTQKENTQTTPAQEQVSIMKMLSAGGRETYVQAYKAAVTAAGSAEGAMADLKNGMDNALKDGKVSQAAHDAFVNAVDQSEGIPEKFADNVLYKQSLFAQEDLKNQQNKTNDQITLSGLTGNLQNGAQGGAAGGAGMNVFMIFMKAISSMLQGKEVDFAAITKELEGNLKNATGEKEHKQVAHNNASKDQADHKGNAPAAEKPAQNSPAQTVAQTQPPEQTAPKGDEPPKVVAAEADKGYAQGINGGPVTYIFPMKPDSTSNPSMIDNIMQNTGASIIGGLFNNTASVTPGQATLVDARVDTAPVQEGQTSAPPRVDTAAALASNDDLYKIKA